jgi:hypothetical protein
MGVGKVKVSTYRIDDEHGNEISCGFRTKAEAKKAAKAWSKRTGNKAYVSEDRSTVYLNTSEYDK